MQNRIRTALVALAAVLLAACDDAPSTAARPIATDTTLQTASVPPRNSDVAQITQGGRLFAQHCAQCHGAGAEGDPNWRQRGADGRFPPPPLNGTGHAWHHPKAQLFSVIKHGSPGGQGNMPAWEDKLSDAEIEAIIAWFQAQWPDEVYAAWYGMEQRARNRGNAM